jgi:ribosome biogenesis protein MAK21
MAKSKARKASGNQLGAPSKASTPGSSTKPFIPTFDEAALSSLTQKIETQLSKPASDKRSKTKAGKIPSDVVPQPPSDNAQNASKDKDVSSKKGKKRARNGDILTSRMESGSNSKHSTENRGNTKFEQEVYALGGTEEDLELIAILESESEMDGEEPRKSDSKKSLDEKSLRKEVNKLVKDIGQMEDLREATSSEASIDSDETESLPDIVQQKPTQSIQLAVPALIPDNKPMQEKNHKLRRNLVSVLRTIIVKKLTVPGS